MPALWTTSGRTRNRDTAYLAQARFVLRVFEQVLARDGVEVSRCKGHRLGGNATVKDRALEEAHAVRHVAAWVDPCQVDSVHLERYGAASGDVKPYQR